MRLLTFVISLCIGVVVNAATVSWSINKTTSAPMHWHVIVNDTSQGTSAGSMTAAPNYASTANTGTIFTASVSTTQAGSITIFAYNGSMANFGTWGHSQFVAAGAYAAGTLTWTAGQTAGLGAFTLSGSAPASYVNYTFNRCITNLTGFVARARVTVTRTGSGSSIVTPHTVQPGQPLCVDVADTNAFTVNIETEVVLPDGMGTGWVGNPQGPTGTNSVSSPPTPVDTSGVTNGNIWNNQDATTRLGAPPVASETAQTRTDTSASTGDTLQRQMEANQEKRHLELKSLLAAQDRNQGIRDAIALDGLNQGLSRLNASVWGAGQSVSNALSALGANPTLSVGTYTNLPPIGNGTGGLGGFTNGASGATGLVSWVPSPGSIGSEPWSVTWPLATVGGSGTVAVSMAGNPAATFVPVIRSLCLLFVTLCYVFGFWRVTGRIGGL